MGDTTAIAWTDKTWNPWQGCHKVSAGCRECYMYREKKRYGQDAATVRRSSPPTFRAPRKWKDPARVFVCSWSDFFIEEADPWRDEAWEIIRAAPHLTFQIPTKRPERIARCLPADWPLPNVWIGVSVENQAAADERIPHLLATPAAVRFLSCEPLLDAVRLPMRAVGGADAVDWVIVGGESGPRARACWVPDVRRLVRTCQSNRLPVFVKQLGANVQDRNDAGWDGCEPDEWPDHIAAEDRVEHDLDGTRDDYQGAPVRVRLRDRKGGDPAEWPADLRVREFPEARAALSPSPTDEGA